MSNLSVTIVGGGLVGSMATCFMARRGYKVDLYEYRDDIRTLEHVQGKSINLALSFRGRNSLKVIGLEEEIVKQHGIPMYARMIHATNGKKRPIYYGKKDQYILSVSRRHLNELLLSAAEKYSNVNIHFQHKLVSTNLVEGKGTYRIGSTDQEITSTHDLIVGCDGAFSVVRREMTKLPGFNYTQVYIEHGYIELCIPPASNGEFAMEKNYLHIWPRGTFMLIALPNQDKSWTVTLFMPISNFERLNTEDCLLQFFETYFPDVIPLIGKSRLIKDFFAVKPAQLISIKCFPYHIGERVVIMGDAAHAMVPFYGQGMNAGFEDCFILDEILNKYDDIGEALLQFSLYRNPDAETICDLAMYNYIEMRDLVNSNLFLIRKKLDNFLFFLFPKRWIPLYSMVTFSNIRYSEALKKRQQQDKILEFIGMTTVASLVAVNVIAILKRLKFDLSFLY